MSPDRAAREARLMAEVLTSAPHDHAHALMGARLRRDLDRMPAPRPVRPCGDTGGGSVLILAASVPVLALVIGFAAKLAGAVAGMTS